MSVLDRELGERARDTLVDERVGERGSDVRAIRTFAGRRLGSIVDDRYELVRVLGQGSAGAVFEARDLELGGQVALKILHKHLQQNEDSAARFSREIHALSKIAHSAVVRVQGSGRDADGSLYLVMELLEGELLHERIHRGITPVEVLEVGRQLLGALAAAHRRGIVHRDIKPENLFLVDEPSGRIRLKILDFGIAKLTVRESGFSFQTLDGLILGTPEYMSPEMCRGMPITPQADLWAAAASLFHALTGEPPFDDEQVGRLLLKIVKSRAPKLRETHPHLPRSLAEAIDRALEPDLSRRFATARDFLHGLASSAPIDDLDWD